MTKLIIEDFSKPTIKAYELLQYSETPPGFLKSLQKLMVAVEKDPLSYKAYKRLKDEMIEEDEIFQSHKKAFIEWLKEKLEQMRCLKCSLMPEVKEALDALELVLCGRYWDVRTGGFLSTLTDFFVTAYTLVARYGSCSELADWLKIENKKYTCSYRDLILESSEKKTNKTSKKNARKLQSQAKEIKISSPEGKQLLTRLGHGYVTALLLAPGLIFDKDGSVVIDSETIRVEFEWGEVREVICPEGYNVWRGSRDVPKFLIDLDCNGISNLRLLLLLCRFVEMKPIPPSSLPRPQSSLEADELCNQQLLQYYLSGFNSQNWNKTPINREGIMKVLNRFLTFLTNGKPF